MHTAKMFDLLALSHCLTPSVQVHPAYTALGSANPQSRFFLPKDDAA